MSNPTPRKPFGGRAASSALTLSQRGEGDAGLSSPVVTLTPRHLQLLGELSAWEDVQRHAGDQIARIKRKIKRLSNDIAA